MFVLSNSALAAEYTRSSVNIIGFSPNADNRPHKPVASNIIRIVINEASWGAGSTCRENAADLQKSDTHMLSILLTAWASGKSVKMTVDDTLKPIDTVCQVTSLYVH